MSPTIKYFHDHEWREVVGGELPFAPYVRAWNPFTDVSLLTTTVESGVLEDLYWEAWEENDPDSQYFLVTVDSFFGPLLWQIWLMKQGVYSIHVELGWDMFFSATHTIVIHDNTSQGPGIFNSRISTHYDELNLQFGAFNTLSVVRHFYPRFTDPGDPLITGYGQIKFMAAQNSGGPQDVEEASFFEIHYLGENFY